MEKSQIESEAKEMRDLIDELKEALEVLQDGGFILAAEVLKARLALLESSQRFNPLT